MAEHRFDPVAFVVGGLAVAAGAIVLAGGELTSEGRVLFPLGLITVGLAVLVSVVRRDPRVAAAFDPTGDPTTGDHELGGDGRSDLDDLFAPVDDVLTSWPADPAPDPTSPTATTGDTATDHATRDVTATDDTATDDATRDVTAASDVPATGSPSATASPEASDDTATELTTVADPGEPAVGEPVSDPVAPSRPATDDDHPS